MRTLGTWEAEMSKCMRVLLACALAIAVQAVADPIDQCGRIIPSWDCSIFYPLQGGGARYSIDASSVPDSSSRIVWRVVGDVVSCDHACNDASVTDCIINSHVSPCPSTDLGCGVLSRLYYPDIGYLCFFWTSPVYGSLLTPSHGFVAGDTIHVVGIVDYRGVTGPCDTAEGYLWNEVLTTCSDSVSSAEETTWGRLKFLFRR